MSSPVLQGAAVPSRPVLLIRPDANERDAAALAEFGIATTIDPWLEISTVPDSIPAHRLAGMLSASGQGVVLAITSPRTWRHWAGIVGPDALKNVAETALGKGVEIWCTGAGTRDSLPGALGEAAKAVPHAKALAHALIDSRPVVMGGIGAAGPLALLPGSDIARPVLPDLLKDAGWRVQQAAVYRTRPREERPPSAGPLADGAFSAVLLRSPSAVDALCGQIAPEQFPPGTAVVTAGPTTTAAARGRGFRVVECSGAMPRLVAGTVAGTLGVAASPHSASASRDARDEPALDRDSEELATLPAGHPLRTGVLEHSPFLAACHGVRTEVTPVWFMRQAGRSLPEYRAARVGKAMLDSCLDPALASELTLQPVRRYHVDAAIFYSDIMVPLRLAGVQVDIEPGVGPVLANRVSTLADVQALPELGEQALEPIREAVRLTVAELATMQPHPIPLIGFAGAPYTVASYLVEGRPDRAHPRTRALMRDDPATLAALLNWVADIDIAFLRAQVTAGASAVQLFDSWAGELDTSDYLVHVQPASATVLRALGTLGVPRIHFGTGTAHLLPAMRDAGAEVMGVAADTTLDKANHQLGGTTPLQGNVDPKLLSGDPQRLDEHVRAVLKAGREAPAHILNLAHGVPPDTDPQVLAHIVDLAHTAGPASQKGR